MHPQWLRDTLVVAATCLSLVAAPACLAQDKTFELKLSHWVPPAHPLQKALEEWGASVEKASNGTIKYKVYPSQQLGKAFDHYDMARDGIADVTYVSPGYQPGRFPIIDAGNLPFMVSNAKEDFPDPETPVITVILLWGIESETSLRLWTRAPRICMDSSTI